MVMMKKIKMKLWQFHWIVVEKESIVNRIDLASYHVAVVVTITFIAISIY